jgi:hypothetical protein
MRRQKNHRFFDSRRGKFPDRKAWTLEMKNTVIEAAAAPFGAAAAIVVGVWGIRPHQSRIR